MTSVYLASEQSDQAMVARVFAHLGVQVFQLPLIALQDLEKRAS
jgi:hypothetical protein